MLSRYIGSPVDCVISTSSWRELLGQVVNGTSPAVTFIAYHSGALSCSNAFAEIVPS
jgi:hypothetical protein